MQRYFLYILTFFSLSALSNEHVCQFGDTQLIVNDDVVGNSLSWKLMENEKLVVDATDVTKTYYEKDQATMFIKNAAEEYDTDTKNALLSEAFMNSFSSLTVFELLDESHADTRMFLHVFRSAGDAVVAKWAIMFDVMDSPAVIVCAEKRASIAFGS